MILNIEITEQEFIDFYEANIINLMLKIKSDYLELNPDKVFTKITPGELTYSNGNVLFNISVETN